jgi:hypothetical protein
MELLKDKVDKFQFIIRGKLVYYGPVRWSHG